MTGTDTGVGKTLVAAGLVRGLVSLGLRTAVMKPVASGALPTPLGLQSEDAIALQRASNVRTPLAWVNPYCFEPAIAPHIAAREARIPIEIERIVRTCQQLAADADWVVVEGAGGWMAPLIDQEGAQQTFADIAVALGLPVVLVVGLRLGCLNHALLTRQAIEAHGARFAGWIGNTLEPAMPRRSENLETLQTFLRQPPLTVVPYQSPRQPPSSLVLRDAAQQLTLSVAEKPRPAAD